MPSVNKFEAGKLSVEVKYGTKKERDMSPQEDADDRPDLARDLEFTFKAEDKRVATLNYNEALELSEFVENHIRERIKAPVGA